MRKLFSGNTIYESILVFLMVAIGYGYFSSERDVNANSRLAVVKAFVDEGRFEIDSYHASELYTSDKSYFEGHYYSDKAIGTAVLGVFAYYPVRWVYEYEDIRLTPRLFREWLTFLAVGLPTALIAPFLYFFIIQITGDPARSFIITLAISLGTPLYKYGTAFYGHSLAAVFCLLAFLIWFRARRHGSISLPLAFVSTFLMGFMVITEYPTVILVSLLTLYILFTLYQFRRLFDWRIYIATAAGFIIPTCLLLYYNNSAFGSPFTTGYSHEHLQIFKEAHSTGFMGVGWPNPWTFFYQTFHPSLGIFWQSPILVLSLIGWFWMGKKEEYRAEIYFTISAVVLYILFFSGYYDWSGGVAFSPRHIIPILPLFAIPLAFTPKKFSIPLLVTALVSIFQNLLMAASGFEGLYEYRQSLVDGGHILAGQGILFYEVCLPNVINGYLTNNRGIQLLGLNGPLSLLPLLALELVLSIVYFKLINPERESKQEHTLSKELG